MCGTVCTFAVFVLKIEHTQRHGRSGIQLIYLPPYSPDLNPIEECFSWVKHCIRQRGVEFRNIVEIGHEAEPYLFLYHILNEVPPHACKGWFHHSGYV
jgi:transposase